MPNNIAITEITSPSKLWKVSYNADSAGTKITNLMTSGTFLDRNIGIEISIPKAEFQTTGGTTEAISSGWVAAGTLNGAGDITDAIITPTFSNTNLATYFDIADQTTQNISITPQYTNTAGYISEHLSNVSGISSYYKIKTTSLISGDGSLILEQGDGAAVLYAETGDSANSPNGPTNPSLDLKTNPPSSEVYYTLTAQGSGTVTGKGKGTVIINNTGWVNANTSQTSNEAIGSETSKVKTIHKYIVKSVHGNTVTNSLPTSLTRENNSYEDIEIQPYGYVKIPAGYNPKDRYIYSNKANIIDESQAAEGISLDISNITGNADVTIGTLNNNKYPITANNLTVNGTVNVGTQGWFSGAQNLSDSAINATVGYINKATFEVDGKDVKSKTAGYVSGNSVVGTIEPTSLNFAGGLLHLENNTDNLNITVPKITIKKAGSFFNDLNKYGITQTKPTGTDGVSYLTIDENHNTITTGQAKSNWIVRRDQFNYSNPAGYLIQNNAKEALATDTLGGGQTKSISINVEDNFPTYYIPIVNPSFSGGNISVSTEASYTVSGINEGIVDSVTNYSIDIAANATASRGTIYYNNTKGVISKTNTDIAIESLINPALATPDNKTIFLQEADFDINANAATANIETSPGTLTISTSDSVIANKTKLNIAPQNKQNNISTNYYIAIKANSGSNTSSGSISGTANISNITPGYLPSNFTENGNIGGTASVTVKSSASEDYYLPIPKVSGTLGGVSVAGSAIASIANVNNIATISSPTGMAGTDYWEIQATAEGHSGSFKPKYTVTTSGWVNEDIVSNTPISVGVSGDGTGKSLYIPKASFGGKNGKVVVNSAGYLPKDVIIIDTAPVDGISISGGSLKDLSASANFSNNITINNTNTNDYNNGLEIQTIGMAGRDAITYSNSAGFITEHTNASPLNESGNAIPSTPFNGAHYYLKGVKLVAPSSGIAKFDITVPNGSTTEFITFQFQVNTSGNVTVIGPD